MEKKELRKITREELYEVLKNHKRWLYTGGEEGEQADLTHTDLRGTNLFFADLTGAKLSCAKLSYVNLYCANLTGAVLDRADLTGANLTSSIFKPASIRGANLDLVSLTNADIR